MDAVPADTVGNCRMDYLSRIYYVTAHYGDLQGLRLLPLSVPFLLSAAWRLAALADAPAFSPAVWGVLLVASVAASIPIRRYYSRRFGNTEALRGRPPALALTVTAVTLVCLEWVQELRPLPVSLPVVFVAITLARLGLAANRLRPHYLWIAAACLLFQALAPLGATVALRAATLDILVGAGLAVAAIGDDRVLRRVMTHRSIV